MQPVNESHRKQQKRHKVRKTLCLYIDICVGLLELGSLGSTWEGNHVTDVLHTGHEEDETLEAETEASVRA